MLKMYFFPKKSTRTVLLQICHMVQNLCAFEKKKNKHPSGFCPLVLLPEAQKIVPISKLRQNSCQKYESKMLKVIKTSKMVPILCPLSVDIKAHIIRSRWPLLSQGCPSQPFTLHTVKLIRGGPHTEPRRTSDPFCLTPSLAAYVFPC